MNIPNKKMEGKTVAGQPLSSFISYLLIAVAPLCWAGNIVLARGVYDIIPPVTLAFWRWALAFLFLLPFGWRSAHKDRHLIVRNWKMMLLLSFTGIACFNTLLYTAVHTITAINGALIQTAMPAVIILVSMILFREKVNLLQIIGVSLCIFGASLVVLHGRLSALLTLSLAQGDILMIIAVVLYAVYSVLVRKRPAIHPVSFLVYTFGIGSVMLMPLYFWEISRNASFEITPHVVLSVLYVAIFPSIAAYFCWNRGIEQIGANRTGLFINLLPVFASLMAVAFLGESLKAYHVIGMLLIFIGMMLFNWFGIQSQRTRN